MSFDLQPRDVKLSVGGDGTGKTAILDVVERVRDFLKAGNTTSQSFPARILMARDITHHPELINHLESTQGVRSFPDDLGRMRTKPFQNTEIDGLLPAEIVARARVQAMAIETEDRAVLRVEDGPWNAPFFGSRLCSVSISPMEPLR